MADQVRKAEQLRTLHMLLMGCDATKDRSTAIGGFQIQWSQRTRPKLNRNIFRERLSVQGTDSNQT
jgi:hypothetical protein